MIARAWAFVTVGVEARIVGVEADVSSGLPGMSIVGLADTAVRESRDRVRSAVTHSGLDWPGTKIVIALLPASLPKRGSSLDAAIAVAVLAAHDQIPRERLAATVVCGELGLDGRLHAIPGVLAAALAASRRDMRMIVPVDCVRQARLVPDISVGGASTLASLVAILRGEAEPEEPGAAAAEGVTRPVPDLADVRGQFEARRALEIAAAGAHHLAMVGVPGVGKTLLAERLPGILPPLDDERAVEVTSIRSVAGRLAPGEGLVRSAPFEAPHHSASMVAVVGGGQGSRIRIGAVTLAHRGVLFLDEAAEFPRNVLDALRQPLESGEIRIARADACATLPANFHLVIASNPCPCGRGVGLASDCSCSPQQRRRYAARLSGPLLDRIDLRLELQRPSIADLDAVGESSADVAARVRAARQRARARWAQALAPWSANAEVPGPVLRRRWPADEAGEGALRNALATGAMSLRGADRVLRIAWTLADLAGRTRPGLDEVGYAMSLRGVGTSWAG